MGGYEAGRSDCPPMAGGGMGWGWKVRLWRYRGGGDGMELEGAAATRLGEVRRLARRQVRTGVWIAD